MCVCERERERESVCVCVCALLDWLSCNGWVCKDNFPLLLCYMYIYVCVLLRNVFHQNGFFLWQRVYNCAWFWTETNWKESDCTNFTNAYIKYSFQRCLLVYCLCSPLLLHLLHTHTCTHTHTHTHTCKHMQTHTHTHTCTHTHVCARTHAHTHTFKLKDLLFYIYNNNKRLHTFSNAYKYTSASFMSVKSRGGGGADKL